MAMLRNATRKNIWRQPMIDNNVAAAKEASRLPMLEMELLRAIMAP